jgi:hypothetical protein
LDEEAVLGKAIAERSPIHSYHPPGFLGKKRNARTANPTRRAGNKDNF